ncbi:hypothetical protein DV738_g2380, partial [Chaetothyriales sp. CBS 135597]
MASMDPSACRVIYIDDRFNTEGWISRDGLAPSTPHRAGSQQVVFSELPPDLQANVNAFLNVFNQVFVCSSGVSFSTKLSELHEQVKIDCTPIIACFDVGSESRHHRVHHNQHQNHHDDHHNNPFFQKRPQFNLGASATDPDSPPSPNMLRRQITFSAESDESYGVPLLSRIASDLQVDDHLQLIIPVAVVRPRRNESYDAAGHHAGQQIGGVARAPFGGETEPVTLEDTSDAIDPQMMLQCLDAGALDVVKSPLDKAGIMGLTVHAYRIYKNAKKQQSAFMAVSHRARKQSWVGVEEEQPYAYLREAMVKKLLKGICEPQTVIEDYQHRDIHVEAERKAAIAQAIGQWGFDGHQFNEDELVYAAVYILKHAVSIPECAPWRQDEDELVRFMQGCRVAYNSFVLYHNFRHAIDVLQSLFYFLVQIGTLPPYPPGSPPPPHSVEKSPIANLLTHFEGLTLLISAIGHDVGHPGVNNMFLVKLNAPLAQLYNDQSVLEAFHCAAYSQILRRHWPAAFNDKAIRKLMISSILATDMGVHSDYMQQLGNLQEKIHESKVTDSWAPKDIGAFKVLTCGLLIKCADISNVARPWDVAEKWTYLLQEEFAKQGEMEEAVGMETTLFGGPPELGNMLKLANGQIGFMTIFAHPLFSNVADIIPAMGFAADEINKNKSVWANRAEMEKEKQKQTVRPRSPSPLDPGTVSPGTRSLADGSGDPVPDDGEAKSGNESPTNAHASSPIADPPNGQDALQSSKDTGASSPIASQAPQSDSKGTLTPTRGLNGLAEDSGKQDPTGARSADTSEQKLLAATVGEASKDGSSPDDKSKRISTGPGVATGDLTSTPSTVATSGYKTEGSDQLRSDFETKRSRAASVPMQAVGSSPAEAYSVGD